MEDTAREFICLVFVQLLLLLLEALCAALCKEAGSMSLSLARSLPLARSLAGLCLFRSS